MASGEIFIQLSVSYGDDPKVRALARYGRSARNARDLYVQMICYCKENLTDGVVPAEQIGVLAYPDSPKTGEKDAEHLAEVGLIERCERGWYVLAYVKRNETRQELEKRLEDRASGGTLGNHRRWHEFKGIRKPGCRYCESEPDRSTDRPTDQEAIGSGSVNLIGGDPHSHSHSHNPPSPPRGKRGSRRAAYDYGAHPDFERFWDAYPQKSGKAEALKAFLAAVERGHDPSVIIKAAERYRDDPRRNPEMTKYPQGWLSSDRFLDESSPGQRGTGGWLDN